MKREYVKPVMMGEAFVANEYVASCYKINCNVPGTGYLWAESNGQEGLQTSLIGGDTRLTYRPLGACNQWHKGIIQGSDPVPNGYWQETNGTVTSVYYWKENLGSASDYHATRMDKIGWETNPNAS